MDKKPLTIPAVLYTDIDKFHETRNKEGLTGAGYLNKLLNSPVNVVNTIGLDEKVNELTDSLASLQQVNEGLLASKLELQNSLKETEEKNKKLLALYDELNDELNELKNQPPKEIKSGIELKENEFICSPSDEALQLSRKYRPFLKKDGVFTGVDSDYPNFLFNVSVTKYIKNKYE